MWCEKMKYTLLLSLIFMSEIRVCLNFYHLAPSGKFNFIQRYIFRRTVSSYAWASGYIQYSLRAAARSSFFIE